MRNFLPLLLVLTLGRTAELSAQTPNKDELFTGTINTRFISPTDTVLLTVEADKKIIHHYVKPKQTLFSLAKFYGLSLEELYSLHPEFQNDPILKAGALIAIPIPNRAIRRYKGKNFDPAKFAPICYVVQAGDNLFQISKRYFSMPVDTIMKRNRLKSGSIQPGQILHVGWMGTDGIQAGWRSSRAPTALSTHKAQYETEKKSRKEVQSQGVCFWQRDSNEKGDLYALHREAVIGTVMGVTNPMTRKTVYAKVIGRIPYGYESNVEVVLSPAAARQIGARDPRFFVKVNFLK